MEEKKSLKERITLISNELKIGKDGVNEYAKYSYFKPDDLLNALKPLLVKYRVFYIFNPEELEGGLTRYQLTLEDFDSAEERVYHMTVPGIEMKGTNAIQIKGAQRTYVLRYLLMAAFGVADDADDLDNEELQKREEEARKKDEQQDRKKDNKQKNEKKQDVEKNPEPKSDEKQPEPKNEPDPTSVHNCEECGEEIVPNKTYTVDQIIEIGKQKYNKCLCAACIRKNNKLKEESAKQEEKKDA